MFSWYSFQIYNNNNNYYYYYYYYQISHFSVSPEIITYPGMQQSTGLASVVLFVVQKVSYN